MAEPTVAVENDAALVRAHRAGRADAFDELFRRYYPRLVAWALRHGNDHARSEDIAQETMMAAARYIGTFDANRPVWPWLRRIAAREAARGTRDCHHETPVAALPDSVWSIEGDFAAMADRSILTVAFRDLPPRQQTALWLRYAEERPGQECADAMGITPNAFDQLIWRAKRVLRIRLESQLRGLGSLVAGLPGVLARLWRRPFRRQFATPSTMASFSSAAAPLAAIMSVGIALLPQSPAVMHQAERPRLIAAAESRVQARPSVHRNDDPQRRSGRPRVEAQMSQTRRRTTHAKSHGSPAQVHLARNPLRNGKQEHDRILIPTPIGTISVGGRAWGEPGRKICHLVSCS